MLKLKNLLALAVVGTGLLGCAIMEVQKAETPPESRSELPYSIDRNCFTGNFADYEMWESRMLEKGVSRENFSNRFPRSEYDEYRENLECYFFTYPVDDLAVEGYLIRQRRSGNDKPPVLILNRGGNAASGRVNTALLFHSALPLASQGFVVIGSQYRGSRPIGQKGKRFGTDEFGGRDVDDVMALFDLIDKIPDADSERIGMLGFSRGGFMTFIAATRTDRLSAIAVGSTPSDLLADLEKRPDMENVYRARIPDYAENKVASLRQRSPLFLVEQIDPELPILILHGQSDERVSLANALNLAARLNDLDRLFRLVVYENDGHGLWRHRREFQNELAKWFKSTLGPEAGK